jgi:hypothetical protein
MCGEATDADSSVDARGALIGAVLLARSEHAVTSAAQAAAAHTASAGKCLSLKLASTSID